MKNKRNFIIILIISIITIVVFSLFLTRYLRLSRLEYSIASSSVVMDANKNYFSIDADAKLKIKWNGNYYLQYDDKNINLGKKTVIYNDLTGQISLYGTFYKINSDGMVQTVNEETIISNSTDTSFYKMDDRKYVVIDRTIYNKDRTLETSNYLLVELDVQGNAKLSNNKINLKTLNETTILTSKYAFDVANEVISFGNNDIDLKKIVGTTNVHKKKDDDSNQNIDNNGSINNGNANGNNQDANIVENPQIAVPNSEGIINNQDNDSISSDVIDNLKNKSKLTSVVSIRENITSLDIDYVIYDPYNEYESIYVEIKKGNNLEIIYLNKNNETLTIKDLLPDTIYNLKFYYTYINSDKELVKENFEEVNVKTLKPSYNISIYRISKIKNKLTYKVNMQSGFNVSRVNANLKFKYIENEIEKIADIDDYIDVTGSPDYVLGTIDISSYNISEGTLLYLTLNSVIYDGRVVNIGSTYTFSMGG